MESKIAYTMSKVSHLVGPELIRDSSLKAELTKYVSQLQTVLENRTAFTIVADDNDVMVFNFELSGCHNQLIVVMDSKAAILHLKGEIITGKWSPADNIFLDSNTGTKWLFQHDEVKKLA